MTQIEQSTIYAYKLKYLENPNFDKIRSFAKNFIDELPPDLQSELYEKINRGIDQLETEPEMLVYLYSFGNMHQAKLNYAFEHLPDSFFEQNEINIIDYGCGQAIGTMCYVDFLKRKNPNQKIKSVTFIEPSEICLKRAGLHISVFLPDTDIRLINKTFDQLSDDDVVCDENIPTLHILSNVLDLDFDLPHFSSLISRNTKGYNQFVCVGPYFNYSDKDQRMQEFAESVNGDVSFAKMLDKGELFPLKSWTCQAVVFSLGKDEESLSTEVTEYEIENGVEDEYGVVYSKDGKRLLRAPFELSGEYSIKKGAKIICHTAFWRRESLRAITIPSSVISIEDSAFSGCESLQSIIIPNSVTNIGDCTFYRCKSLCAITIPNSVTSIGAFVFYECDSLKSIDIPNSVTSIGDSAFSGCESLQSIIIPNSVTSIEDWGFSYCYKLQSITIPNSVTNIGELTFLDCKSLRSITIPNSVTSIKNRTFSGCIFLQSITIPNSVTSIGTSAFEMCISLESISISNNVTNIGEKAFYYCKSLQSIYIPLGSRKKFEKMLPEYKDKLKEV